MGAINRHTVILVFPDYSSTGLWIQPSGQSIEPSRVGVSSGLQIALKYWHDYWELNITDTNEEIIDYPYYKKVRIAKWLVDGYELARLMTNESEEYDFRYKE